MGSSKDFSVISHNDIVSFVALISNRSQEFKVRTNIFTMEDFLLFFKKVTLKANVKYHHYNRDVKVQQYIYSETFVCHHSGRKTKLHNLQCTAKITVRIKHNKYHTRKNDKLVVDFPCFISSCGFHSHEIQCIDSVSKLKVRSPAKNQLQQLYKEGMGPQEALNEMKEQMSPQKIANRSLLPNLQTAYYEHRKFTLNQFGDLGGNLMSEAIEDLKVKYPEARISFQHPTTQLPFCLFLQTPLMSRVLSEVRQSSEIIFMDSTTNLDQMNSTLTTFHTWTPAGGVPIGLAITETQTIRDYECALLHLKYSAKDSGFFGSLFPESFMTDDSDAEKSALQSIFPNSKRLLCQFHVLQAMWRWLWDKKHDIDLSDRKPLMILVRELVASRTEEEFLKTYRRIIQNSISRKYPAFVCHIKKMVENAEEWALCYRTKLKTRGHNTNNFSERGMGIIKSTVLKRIKAYNVTQLAETLITDYDKVIRDRLLDVALMRSKARHNSGRNSTIPKNHIDHDENSGLFFVQSQDDSQVNYLVDTEIPICSCIAGASGKFCKHILAIEHWFPEVISIPRVESKEECFQLLKLAIGQEASKYSEFYQLPKDTKDIPLNVTEMNEECNHSRSIPNFFEDNEIQESLMKQALFENCCTQLRFCCSKFAGNDTIVALQTMSKTLGRLHDGSKGSFLSALHTFGKGWISSAKRTRRRGQIKVQPTAVARRKDSQPKGNAALMKGRVLKKKKYTRVHNLMRNVHNNLANGKKH